MGKEKITETCKMKNPSLTLLRQGSKRLNEVSLTVAFSIPCRVPIISNGAMVDTYNAQVDRPFNLSVITAIISETKYLVILCLTVFVWLISVFVYLARFRKNREEIASLSFFNREYIG